MLCQFSFNFYNCKKFKRWLVNVAVKVLDGIFTFDWKVLANFEI